MGMMIEMSEKKKLMIKRAKDILDRKEIYYIEMDNGQLQVDGVNYWCTSEKFYNPKTGVKGVGFNAFIKHLKDNNII